MATEQEVAQFGAQFAQQYGLRVTNQRRSAERNRQVGGAKNSDHLTGLALDMSGDPKQMAALASWARQNMGEGKLFRWVGWGDESHLDHVHLSFNASASPETRTVSAQSSGDAVMAEQPLPPDATPDQIRKWIQDNAPEIGWMLSNEEIMGEVIKWVREEEPPERLNDRLRATNYWSTHSAASRAFDALIGQDGSAAGALVDKTKRVLGDSLNPLGVVLDDEQLGSFAKQAIRNGWVNINGQVLDQDAINDAAVFMIRKGGVTPPGEIAFDADQVEALAKNYLVPISRQDAEHWAQEIRMKRATMESFTSWVTGLAKARFADQPDIIAAIDGGATPAMFFSGAKTLAAKILELDPNTVDLMDPKWLWISETRDEKGNRRAPTLGEIAQMARDRPEFANTRTYKETTADYALNLSRFLGQAA